MFSLKRVVAVLLSVQAVLFASVSVFPNQGNVGDEFSFKVDLDKKLSSEYSDIYLRIFEDNNETYDYKMSSENRLHYSYKMAIHQIGEKRLFTIGIEDHHGQVHWSSQKWTYRVIDNTVPITDEKPIQKKDTYYASQAYENARASLKRKSGYTLWNGIKRHGRWATSRMTYCARFVRMCFGEPGKYDSAKEMFNHFKQLHVIKKDTIPPKGAVVFYSTSSKHGHTGIADGLGGLYSASSYVKGIRHMSIETNTTIAALEPVIH
jgi:hypothetical protein